jgi:hypothetical protein
VVFVYILCFHVYTYGYVLFFYYFGYTTRVSAPQILVYNLIRGSGRLRLRIFLTFDTMKVVGRHPYAPADFTPRSILVLIFRG